MLGRHHIFTRFAKAVSDFTGRPIAFILAGATVLAWAITGPLFDYSETWQLVINTGTTIVTFLMVFLIQNAQNRDTHALQIKLDELIRATEGAHTALLDLEELSDEELSEIRNRYEKIAAESRKQMKNENDDTHVPHIELPGTGAYSKRAPRKFTKKRSKR
jgi:low affinity Fe/Cu permease